MKVHLCLPTFNNEATIEQTLDSLLSQSFYNFEISLVDNNSSDQTLEKITKYLSKDARLELIRHSQNIGGEKNFEFCLKMAKHDLFAVFHSDDLYHKECLAFAVDFFQKNPTCSALSFQASLIDHQGNNLGRRFFPKELAQLENPPFSGVCLSAEELFKLSLKYGNIITCPGVIFRTSFVVAHIQTWCGELFKTSADLDVWLRTALQGKFFITSKILMSYRESSASFSYKLSKTRIHRHDLFLVLDHYFSKFQPSLSQKDLNFYAFLDFKDYIFRQVTRLKRKVTLEPKRKIPWKIICLVGIKTPWHFKYAFYMTLFPVYFFLKKVFSK